MIRTHFGATGLSKQFLRFVLANVIAALVNIGTKLVASFFMLDTLAILTGFCAGLSTSYLLCRNFVFQPSATSRFSEISRFTAVNLAALGITYGTYRQILDLLHNVASLDPASRGTQTMAHAVGVAAPVFFSFLVQRTVTFRQRSH